MAKYLVTLDDGRTITVNADDETTVKAHALHHEKDRFSMAVLRGQQATSPVPSRVESITKIED